MIEREIKMRWKHCSQTAASLVFLLVLSGEMMGQDLSESRKMYYDGQYAEAKAAFGNLLKRSPSNANLNFWYGACNVKTGDWDEAEKYLSVAAKRRLPDAYKALGDLYMLTYKFEAAQQNYDKYIEQLRKSKKEDAAASYALLSEKASKANFMLNGIEKVNVIDSVVVDKQDFLSVYKLSGEAGTIMSCDELFKTNDGGDCTAYKPQIGNYVFFGHEGDDGRTVLCKSYTDGGDITQATMLPDVVNAGKNQNYPYLLSDGTTIYYASDCDESIGGYDIFVSAYNTSLNTYVAPQNIGMPFNSPYNDYMLAIDEYSNLGWFASDRFQPEGKVCVYVFVPSQDKDVYDTAAMTPEQVVKVASIRGFHDTQLDATAVNAALKRLQGVLTKKVEENEDTGGLQFVVNDRKICSTIYDFKSRDAQNLFKQWQKMKSDEDLLLQKLENLRTKYHALNKEARGELNNYILDLEKRIGELKGQIGETEKRIREKELN